MEEIIVKEMMCTSKRMIMNNRTASVSKIGFNLLNDYLFIVYSIYMFLFLFTKENT
jgi:hypothetical protein